MGDLFVVGLARDKIVWEEPERVRSWCRLPYPAHAGGCPNSDDCQFFYEDLRARVNDSPVVMVAWVEFDLDAQAARMKEKHPTWTERQCRNLLYWQRGVRKTLKESIRAYFRDVDIIMGAEGGGVNFHRTMRKLGVVLDMPKDLHTVRIIALVLDRGKKQTRLCVEGGG